MGFKPLNGKIGKWLRFLPMLTIKQQKKKKLPTQTLREHLADTTVEATTEKKAEKNKRHRN